MLLFPGPSPAPKSVGLKRFGSSKFGNGSSAEDGWMDRSSSRLEWDEVVMVPPPALAGFDGVEIEPRWRLKSRCSVESGFVVVIPESVVVDGIAVR